MKLILAAGLTATTLILGTGPALAAPYDWHETPTGLKGFIPYALDSGGGALWTVGALDGENFEPVAARWDGKSWQNTPQPIKVGRFLAVSAQSAGTAWAVGSQQTPGDPSYQDRLLVERWNGKAWKVVPTPTFNDDESRELTALAVQGGQVWTAGLAQSSTFAYRYDGKKWVSVSDPVIARSGYIYDLAAISPTNVWAATFDGLLHYDGRHWQSAKLPGDTSNIVLSSLAVTTANDIWVVGHREDPEFRRRPLAYHYDGKSWTEVATPAEGAELRSVSLIDGQPVAVGETRAGGPYLLAMTAKGFARQPDPAGASNLFTSTTTEGRLWIGGIGDGSGSADSYVGFTKTG
ncbi:hypothetical protein F1D05_18445 [Kribbella qitaiheensis]|uniref:Exo-alpha-sialidase n=1 Tax=Kribbella qitaiheensis TaxID=1544730 RepID=A0A7G6WZW8_9ACTN|nr:hypothetical protein [Kribbella qitaiheensis]QNE19533.1 hypothetical protein F1D05_18445 [Kribbella qitaiheensis]